MINADFDLQKEPKSAFASFEEATRYLEDCCARFNVLHLSYWLLSQLVRAKVKALPLSVLVPDLVTVLMVPPPAMP